MFNFDFPPVLTRRRRPPLGQHRAKKLIDGRISIALQRSWGSVSVDVRDSDVLSPFTGLSCLRSNFLRWEHHHPNE